MSCRGHRDPLLWAACRAVRRLAHTRPPPPDTLAQLAEQLQARQKAWERAWRMYRKAVARGWHAAATNLWPELVGKSARVHAAAGQLTDELGRRLKERPVEAPSPPPLRDVLAELRQLAQEFDQVEVRARQMVLAARTEPITLIGVELGPFSIELDLNNLGPGAGAHCLSVVALEPNPASSNAGVTHPHVQDRKLCAGDATLPLCSALRQGRLAEAFLLVASVLRQYNPSSPYVPMEDWSGTRCGDCDQLTRGEDSYYCDGCGRDVCDNCYRDCDCCGEGRCLSCLELDEESDLQCCGRCRRTCARCERTVDRDSFVEASGLCPGCHEEANPPEEGDADDGADEAEEGEASAVPAAATLNITPDTNSTDEVSHEHERDRAAGADASAEAGGVAAGGIAAGDGGVPEAARATGG